jgi:uncharacterized protein YbaR (Trm112 family)
MTAGGSHHPENINPGVVTSDDGRMRVDPRLLEILVCPITRSALEYNRERAELISRKAKLAFPIRDGIPIMLHDEARKLEE